MKKIRTILDTRKGFDTQDGAGVKLTRVLSRRSAKMYDPFLMLDSFDSINPEDYTKGFPWHPHRGIETVTYLIEGLMIHEDSLGNKGEIKNKESQWMTAGSGILHQEMPQVSDRMLGYQLWINLPQKDKMTKPHYNDLSVKNNIIKEIEEENCIVRIISGRYKNIEGFISPYVDTTILDVELQPNSKFVLDVKNENTVFVFNLLNEMKINTEIIEEKTAVLLDDGNQIEINSLNNILRFSIFEGKSLNEEISWAGPIVMNTEEELQLAFEELDNGTFIKDKEIKM